MFHINILFLSYSPKDNKGNGWLAFGTGLADNVGGTANGIYGVKIELSSDTLVPEIGDNWVQIEGDEPFRITTVSIIQ